MNEQIAQLQKRIEELEAFKSEMMDYSSLPYNVENAIRGRLGGFAFATSTKSVNTERDQSDDALGIHYAQAVADGYLELQVNGSTYYFPVYFSAT